jgi:hypothetical protein
MKLNHLNLTVSNVPETHRFLEKYFGLKSYVGTEPREAMENARLVEYKLHRLEHHLTISGCTPNDLRRLRGLFL